jgi:glycosyltransferase involved in cell wall biosynthesis
MNITTVIPVRNRIKFIARALGSVAAQTNRSTEIIVVDDASTDGTREFVAELAKNTTNLKLIPLDKNVGAAEARNIGVRHATGDLIAFLDSDDAWYPEKLEKQITEFKSTDGVVAVFCGSRVVYSDRSFCHMPAADITLTDLFYSNALSTTSSALISKKALVEVGGFDGSLPSCQDWDLFIRLAEIGKIRVVQEELIEFLNHDEGRISRNKAGILAGHETVRGRIYKRISDPAMLRKVRGSHECTLADIFSSLIYEPGRAAKHALLGIALAPSAQSLRILARVIRRTVSRATSNA